MTERLVCRRCWKSFRAGEVFARGCPICLSNEMITQKFHEGYGWSERDTAEVGG